MRTVNFLILIAVGVLICMLYYSTCNNATVVVAPPVPTVKEQIKVVEKFTDTFKKKYDSLQAARLKDADKAKAWEKKYQTEKERAQLMAKLIDEMPMPDEHREKINDYFEISTIKDTACDSTIISLKSEVSTQDSIIAAQQAFQSKLRASIDTAMVAQEKLTDYGNQLKKQLLKKKVGNFLWKSAAVAGALVILKNNLK